ncbi:cation transporter [Candidatus Microgenomates bacterium]|nr:cation transporter [Candidatus Microgenomates bacterium]
MEARSNGSFQVRSLVAIVIVLVVTLFQLILGVVFSGTALLQEATHNFIDGPIYWLPALSERWIQPPERGHTVRGCIVSPYLAKGSAILLIISAIGFAIWSGVELVGGHDVKNPSLLLMAAVIGLLGNLLIKEVFHYEGHVEFDENKEASEHHVLGDVTASIAAVITYVIVITTDTAVVDLFGTFVGGSVIILFNLRPALKPPPRRWHRRRDHDGG